MHWKKKQLKLALCVDDQTDQTKRFFFWDMPAKQMMLFSFFNFIHLDLCLFIDIRNI